jgi:N-acetyl-anhydromuramyl-L-alanine amidase AmpD
MARVRCRRAKLKLSSVKHFFSRPFIKPRIIVLHSTESGVTDHGRNDSFYLAGGSVQADVHVVIGDDGTKWRLVPDGRKAWHVAGYNPIALGIEHDGRASQGHWPDAQLRASACQAAYWCRRYGIPAVLQLNADGSWNGHSGIVTHKSLGQTGGGHLDPGPNFPLHDYVKRVKAKLAAS